LDIVDEFINSRYSTVLESTDFIGLKAHTSIATTAAYQSGADTVALMAGTNAVTGTGTQWTVTAKTGQKFYIPGDQAVYTIEVMSDTFLALDRAYAPRGSDPLYTAYPGCAYVLMQDLYLLPADCRSIVTVLDPRTNLPLTPFTKDGLDAAAGPRTRIGYPTAWAEYDDTPESTQSDDAPGLFPVLHRIQLSPPPLQAAAYVTEYLRAAAMFDGRTLSAFPLPFVSPAAILAGVRADIALYNGELAKAAGYEKLFQNELAKLLQVEHAQRRVKTAMRMADRFTRHRLQRVNRGYPAHGWAEPGGPT
jgi:hypothetical protein